MKKAIFYMGDERLELAFSNRLKFGQVVKGLQTLGVPFYHTGRLNGTMFRLSIEKEHIYSFSKVGDWEFYLKFRGSMNLSLELKSNGEVVIAYPEYIGLPLYLWQDLEKPTGQTYLKIAVTKKNRSKKRPVCGIARPRSVNS